MNNKSNNSDLLPLECIQLKDIDDEKKHIVYNCNITI